MTKELFQAEYLRKKIAVHCDTAKKAEAFLKLMQDYGHGFYMEKDNTYWDIYRSKMAYGLYDPHLMYCDKEYYEKQGYEIITYDDFIAHSDNLKDLIKVGYLVRLRDDELYQVMPYGNGELAFIDCNNDYLALKYFDKDLNFVYDFDVLDIYGYETAADEVLSFKIGNRPLIWKREDEKIELYDRECEILKAYQTLGAKTISRQFGDIVAVTTCGEYLYGTDEADELFDFIEEDAEFNIENLLGEN